MLPLLKLDLLLVAIQIQQNNLVFLFGRNLSRDEQLGQEEGLRCVCRRGLQNTFDAWGNAIHL